MYYVYLILCTDESIYTGMTSDPERRFIEHVQKSGGRYTKLHKPIQMKRVEEFGTKLDALRRERQIKGWRREKKLNLIKFGHPNSRPRNHYI
ncbi:hypothetical protein COB55_01505 [Candidatus Wolfebacteria bacterium]|nr:MAG: hypothetical protein COB55_01505 [Candidatus Wolfebacteria bacterium]